jgi:hypothetical protein
VWANKTGYWKINIYNYGTAHYGGAFFYGKIGQLDNWTNALFGIVLLDRAGKRWFAMTKLQQEVT